MLLLFFLKVSQAHQCSCRMNDLTLGSLRASSDRSATIWEVQ